MDFALSTLCLLAFASFIAGFIDSVAGGGGLITIPSLLFAGIPPQLALGTNKLNGCFGTGIAVINFAHKKLIWWPLVALGIGFTFLGGALGSRAILAIDESVVSVIIVCLLPLAATTLLWKRSTKSQHHNDRKLKPIALKATLICFAVGFYDGFFGPGTGTFLALGFFSVLHLNLLNATANAKVFNFVSNLSSLVIFLIHQKVLFAVAIPMGIANMAGNFLGSHMAIKRGDGFVKQALLGVLMLLFGTLAWKIHTRVTATTPLSDSNEPISSSLASTRTTSPQAI